jgi:hypothetical protein
VPLMSWPSTAARSFLNAHIVSLSVAQKVS